MRDNEFDKTLDTWADQEAASAPDMRPTQEMYRLVRARAKRRLFLALPRWTTVGAAAASLVVLTIVSTLILYPTILGGTSSESQLAYIKQREGFAAHKGGPVKGTPTGKGPRRGSACLQPLFQTQKQGSQFVEEIDLRSPPTEPISLTAEDNYRLLLEPVGDCYAYAFQLTSSGELVKLYPNEAYSAALNPLRQGQPVYVPSQSIWLYVDGKTGQERLFVIASAQPLQALDDLYTQYSQARKPRKPQALAELLERIDPTKETFLEHASGWTLYFDHR
jgi:hypothetical protein